MPFSVHTAPWSGEHRAFVVEEFIQNGGSPIMMQRAFRIPFTLCRRDPIHQLHQRPLHSPKVTVWCAIFYFGVWGQYFFEEDDVTVTVTSDRYCAMPENFLRPKLDDLLEELFSSFFLCSMEQKMCGFNKMVQQPTHLVIRLEFSEKFKEMFPGHVVSLRGDIGWPPHSPDFTPCDFFLSRATSKPRYTNIVPKLWKVLRRR
jgi:hypothetical protein